MRDVAKEFRVMREEGEQVAPSAKDDLGVLGVFVITIAHPITYGPAQLLSTLRGEIHIQGDMAQIRQVSRRYSHDPRLLSNHGRVCTRKTSIDMCIVTDRAET